MTGAAGQGGEHACKKDVARKDFVDVEWQMDGGVHLDGDHKWTAEIETREGGTIDLGVFESISDAEAAFYAQARLSWPEPVGWIKDPYHNSRGMTYLSSNGCQCTMCPARVEAMFRVGTSGQFDDNYAVVRSLESVTAISAAKGMESAGIPFECRRLEDIMRLVSVSSIVRRTCILPDLDVEGTHEYYWMVPMEWWTWPDLLQSKAWKKTNRKVCPLHGEARESVSW